MIVMAITLMLLFAPEASSRRAAPRAAGPRGRRAAPSGGRSCYVCIYIYICIQRERYRQIDRQIGIIYIYRERDIIIYIWFIYIQRERDRQRERELSQLCVRMFGLLCRVMLLMRYCCCICCFVIRSRNMYICSQCWAALLVQRYLSNKYGLICCSTALLV